MTFHERSGPRLFLAAIGLGVLLIVLAVLQYRWLGDVSAAERERMRASLQTRTGDFTQAFDAEITRAFVAFHVDPAKLDESAAATLSDAYASWQSSAETRGTEFVRAVYVVDPSERETAQVRKLDPAKRALDVVSWPPELADWLSRLRRQVPAGAPASAPLLVTDAVDATIPAVIVASPRVRRSDGGAQFTVIADASSLARAIVVEFDAARLHDRLLVPLVRKYFADDYLVSVVRRDDPSQVLFASDARVALDKSADVTAGLFDVRMDDVNRLASPESHTTAAGRGPNVAITIVRRGNGADGRQLFASGVRNQGAWRVFVRHRADSLDAIVASSRRRNLALVLAVLGLLAGSIALIMRSADRQRRLARQQMAFVAAVSHELRTPLAVICSAGENLADGVINDAEQVRKYGSLVETEGRRLGDMVERVLLFAGIGSGVRTRAVREVDIARIVGDAVAGVGADARDRGVTIDVHHAAALPPVAGDVEALRSAVQNVVGNAVKYSARDGRVDVNTELVDGAIIRIRVVDRGIGIDPADLPHVFKPFYRGRRAVEAEVRGSGIGLSVVQHVVREHGGDVRVESRAGEGTTVTMVLPAESAADSADERRRIVVRFKLKEAASRS